jgi:hypothetical protein
MLAFVYQRHNVGLLTGWVTADAPITLRASSAWSLLQIWITALLAMPVALASVATMFGAESMRRLLGLSLATGATMSAGVLTIHAVLAVPRVADGGPFLLANPRITYELAVNRVAVSRRRIHDHSRHASRHDTRRAAVPGPPAPARG